MIILFSLFYIIFVFTDLPFIFRNKNRKLFWIYLIITLISYLMVVLIGMDVEIPSPAPVIKKIVISVFNL